MRDHPPIGARHEPRPSWTVAAERDAASPLAGIAPGVRVATDDRPVEFAATGPLAALPVAPQHPPHPRLEALCRLAIPGVVMPVGRIATDGEDWIICRAPSGPSLRSSARPTGEAALLATVLRPAARTLLELSAHRLTHRAIRPDNVFVDPNGAVQLGPFWLGPPGLGQDACYEPTATASCLPEARGPGQLADDVYALGVLLLELLLGARPLEGMPERAVIARKQERGSLQALLDGRTLPAHLHDLLDAMLSDDPRQRPSPERLAGSGLVVGPNLVMRRQVTAAVPLRLDGQTVWTMPQLATLIGDEPGRVRDGLRLGLVDQWLRRSLNEVVLAERIEAVARPAQGRSPFEGDAGARADIALLRVARLLDPDAPLVWQGVRVQLSGLGPLLAALDSLPAPTRAAVLDLIAGDAIRSFAETIEDLAAREAVLVLAKRARAAAASPLALTHLTYELNPALACRSSVLKRRPVSELSALLPMLDAACGERDATGEGARRAGSLLDADLVAFIAVRRRPARPAFADRGPLDELRMLAGLALETQAGSLPAVAGALAAASLAAVDAWPGRAARDGAKRRIASIAEAGRLDALLALVEDDTARHEAEAAGAAAATRLRDLTARRDAIASAGPARRARAERFGRESLAVIGVGATALALLAELAL